MTKGRGGGRGGSKNTETKAKVKGCDDENGISGDLDESKYETIAKTVANNLISELKATLATKAHFDEFYTSLASQIADIEIKFEAKLAEEIRQRDSKIDELTNRVAGLEEKLVCSVAKVDVVEKREVDLMVIGDSIVRYVEVEDINPDGENELVCLPGARCFQVYREIRKASSAINIKNMVIHCGSNNLPDCMPHQVANQIVEVLRDTRLNLPDCNLLFSAILPKIGSDFTSGINHVNFRVFKACQEMGIGYINHPFVTKNGIMDMSMYRHQEVKGNRPVHLNTKGVGIFTGDISQQLK